MNVSNEYILIEKNELCTRAVCLRPVADVTDHCGHGGGHHDSHDHAVRITCQPGWLRSAEREINAPRKCSQREDFLVYDHS